MIVFYIEVNLKKKRYVRKRDRYNKSNKKNKSHGPPHNILRNMSIISRIQRLFHCKELAMLQGWHASHISDSGVM
jgi:hypothetical protein